MYCLTLYIIFHDTRLVWHSCLWDIDIDLSFGSFDEKEKGAEKLNFFLYEEHYIIMYHASKVSFDANALSFPVHYRCTALLSLVAGYFFSFFFRTYLHFQNYLFYSNSCRYYTNCDPRGGSSGASHVNYEQCGDSGWSYSAVCTGPGHSIFCPRCAFASFPIRDSKKAFQFFCFYYNIVS